MPQLICQDLTIGYEGKAIITGLSFTVNTGDYLCIVGQNGSGKSTLLKTLLNLKKPLSGQIISGDGLKPDKTGYIPQQTQVQKDFPASVREVVRSGCLNRCGLRPYYGRAEKRIAEEYMEKLGISSLAKCYFRELSGGQQQRVLLARALCAARKLLMLDEPAAGLDPEASAEMNTIISELNSNGVTIILVSHDLSSSIKDASHILHIENGAALFFGTKADYMNSGLGRVYVNREDTIS